MPDSQRHEPVTKPAAPAPPAAGSDKVSFKTWVAVLSAMMGAFLAVLNIQITNASLADIQGGIGAGLDNGGWITTSYLVSEIIVIPLCAWLTDAFSLRRYLIGSAILFLVFSCICPMATNLGQMIVFRALQGFFGGVLIPLAFTIVITKLPRSKQPIGMSLFAITATFSPAIGPTIGGYLTEHLNWHYAFYVNLVPGIFMVAGLWWALEASPMKLYRLKEGDWFGIATAAIGLGALQTVLEEGNKDDWFGSPFILRLTIVAAIALAMFVAWEMVWAKRPLVNLRLLGRRNFSLGTIGNICLGAALYSNAYLVPVYLSQSQGYNPEQIGLVVMSTGIPQLFIIPFNPWLMKRFGSQALLVFGGTLFAVSCYMNAHLSPDYAGPEFLIPNIVRALGQAVLLTPLSSITTAGIERENAGSASALFNMLRNMGGAIGIAGMETFVSKREQFHSSIIDAHVSLFSEATRQRIRTMQDYFLAHGMTDPAQAMHAAIIGIGHAVRAQAYFLAYSDGFLVMGVEMFMVAVVAFLMKKPASAGGGGGH